MWLQLSQSSPEASCLRTDVHPLSHAKCALLRSQAAGDRASSQLPQRRRWPGQENIEHVQQQRAAAAAPPKAPAPSVHPASAVLAAQQPEPRRWPGVVPQPGDKLYVSATVGKPADQASLAQLIDGTARCVPKLVSSISRAQSHEPLLHCMSAGAVAAALQPQPQPQRPQAARQQTLPPPRKPDGPRLGKWTPAETKRLITGELIMQWAVVALAESTRGPPQPHFNSAIS